MRRIMSVFVVITLVLVLATFLIHKKQLELSVKNVSSTCEFNNQVTNDLFFNKYSVKPGDTLLSIAKNELGDNSRIDEIININTAYYPELTPSNKQLKVGWILRLPPSFYPKTSGYLSVSAGPVLAVNNDWISINLIPGKNVAQVNYFTNESLLLLSGPLKTGDCVFIVNDTSNRAGTGIVAISKQHNNSLKNPSAPRLSSITGKSTDCIYTDHLDDNFFLKQYAVVKGDNLTKVAESQLGNAARVDELIALNKKKYPNVSRADSFLEVGWILNVPPKYFPVSSGYLIGSAGKIVINTARNFAIDLNNHNAELSTSPTEQLSSIYYSDKRKDTLLIGIDDYTLGKCVYLIEDTGVGNYGAIVVMSQDKSFFR